MNESAVAPISSVPLRPNDAASRNPSEQAMHSSKVVELRRGSAHGAPVAPVTPAASNPHRAVVALPVRVARPVRVDEAA
jgi:hypothetical protein